EEVEVSHDPCADVGEGAVEQVQRALEEQGDDAGLVEGHRQFRRRTTQDHVPPDIAPVSSVQLLGDGRRHATGEVVVFECRPEGAGRSPSRRNRRLASWTTTASSVAAVVQAQLTDTVVSSPFSIQWTVSGGTYRPSPARSSYAVTWSSCDGSGRARRPLNTSSTAASWRAGSS